MGLVVLVVALLLAVPVSASASIIHEPANGLVVPQTAQVRFDWAWDSDQYASALYFSRNPDPSLEVWRQASMTGMEYQSNLTIDFGHWDDLGQRRVEERLGLPDARWGLVLAAL